MVADKREFIRLDVGYVDNPKVADVLEESPVAVVLHVAAMCFARQHRTDGVIPINRLARKVGASSSDVDLLVSLALLDRLDDGRVTVHDYANHQETAEQIERLSAAGKKAARARWDGQRNADRNANRNAEERRGEERREKQPPAASATGGSPIAILAGHGLDESQRDDFLAHLAQNGIDRPSVFVCRLHQRKELAARIEQWRIDSRAASAPRTRTGSRRTTDDKVRDGLDLAARLAQQDPPANVTPLRQIGAP